MEHGEWRQAALVVHHRRNGTCHGDGPHGQIAQATDRQELQIDFQHRPVLVALGIYVRNLPLRERVVERVVDVLDANAEARCDLAVDHQRQLQATGIAVRGHVRDAFDGLHALADDGRPFLQQIEIGARQRILVFA